MSAVEFFTSVSLAYTPASLQLFLIKYNHMYRLYHDRSAETLRHCKMLHGLFSVVMCENNKGSALGKTINYSYIDL